MQRSTISINEYTYRDQHTKNELSAVLIKPMNSTKKLPVLIYVHGHVVSIPKHLYSPISSPPNSLIWHTFVKKGFTVFMPVMLGYGKTGGESDYCGPKTVSGVVTAIEDILLKDRSINKNKIAIYGVSRGANLVAQLMVKLPNLFSCGILQSGFYDAKTSLKSTKIEGIKDNFYQEAGASAKALKERSPILDMERLNCPVLILHGDKDDRADISEAKRLDQKLTKLNKPHKTVIFSETDHYIYFSKAGKIIMEFLEENFKKSSPVH